MALVLEANPRDSLVTLPGGWGKAGFQERWIDRGVGGEGEGARDNRETRFISGFGSISIS